MRVIRPTLTLTIICVVVGFITGFGMAQFRISSYESIGSLASAIAISVATFVWLRSDATGRVYRRSTAFNIAFVGLPILVLPYYLLRSRGAIRGLQAIGVAVAIYIAYVIALVFGVTAVRLLRI
jgi:hypothetical protein